MMAPWFKHGAGRVLHVIVSTLSDVSKSEEP